MGKSKIEYLDYVINDLEGCEPLSQGCKFCWAKEMYDRFNKTDIPFSKVRSKGLEYLSKELKKIKNKPGMRVGYNFMADTFHKDRPLDDIRKAFDLMAQYPQHTFMVLTKRYDRLRNYQELFNEQLPNNVKLGITICDNNDLKRLFKPKGIFIENQRATTNDYYELVYYYSNFDFISIEPLLEELNYEETFSVTQREYPTSLDRELLYEHLSTNEADEKINKLNNKRFNLEELIKGSNHIIVGGESGNNARPMKTDWVRSIRDLCIKHEIPFFFKQYSQHKNKDYKNNELDGKVWEEFPNE